MQSKSISRRSLVAVMMLLLVSLPMLARESSEMKVNLKTSLTGASFNGATPAGRVEYELESSSKKLSFEVRNIVLTAGSVVDVFANGTKVGTITIRNHGGTLLRSTFANQSVPSLSVGSTLTVKFGATTLLHGKF
jgi:hypothetical protein